jgi:hypothetical protein
MPFVQDCEFVTSPAFDRQHTMMIASASTCTTNSAEGLYKIDLVSQQATEIWPGYVGANPSFAPDGSGFAFIGGSTVPADVLYAFDLTMNQAAMLYTAMNMQSLQDVAVAPDVLKLAFCVDNNLVLVDLTNTGGMGATATPLTNDGMSCHPAW